MEDKNEVIKNIVNMIIKRFNSENIRCGNLLFKANVKKNIEKFVKKYINNELYKYKNCEKDIWKKALKLKKTIKVNNKEYIFDVYRFKKDTPFYHAHIKKDQFDTKNKFLWTSSEQIIRDVYAYLHKKYISVLKLKTDIDLLCLDYNNMKNIFEITKNINIKYKYFNKRRDDYCGFIENKYKKYKGYSDEKLKKWNISLYTYSFSKYICKLFYNIDIADQLILNIENLDYDIIECIKNILLLLNCYGCFHKSSYDPFRIFYIEEYMFNDYKSIFDIIGKVK